MNSAIKNISDTPSAIHAGIDIQDVLKQESVVAHFQPIFSIKDTRVIGYEALARATDPSTGTAIPPNVLFEQAARKGLSLELDRLCRKKAAEGFSRYLQDENTLLFINLDSSVLNDQVVGSNCIINLMNEYRINPQRVVIEFIESKVNDISVLQTFIRTHRKYGFMIAIDDLGTGHSNLERIPSMKPDIIKIDRSLISDINKEYHKQELFNFFIKLAHKLGILVIAEGIELLEETLACLELGADLVQGYYFEKPQHPENLGSYTSLQQIIKTRATFKDYVKLKFEWHKKQYAEYAAAADCICSSIAAISSQDYDSILANLISAYPSIECAYILHETGIQISSTVFNPQRKMQNQPILFAPATIGCDLSSKEYFLFLSKTQKRYVTDPYISKASGNICITIASMVTYSKCTTIVVCIDIDASAFVHGG